MAALTGRALVAAMCLGQVGSLLPHVVVPAIMAQHLMPLWDLNAAQAGLMASAYAFGYMLAVPVLTTLTDRIDARRMLMVGSVLSGVATALFGVLANGLWSATLIWSLAGIGFAGAYMPGLKALADRLLSDRFCAIAPRSATFWAMARTASNFTACAPGSWRSGPLLWRAVRTAHSSAQLPSA